MKNRGSTPILPNVGRDPPKYIHKKIEANLCISLRKEDNNVIFFSDIHCKYICSVTT